MIIGLHFQLCLLRVHQRSQDNLSCIPDSMWNRNYHFHLFSIIEVHFSFCSVNLSWFRVWDYNFKSEIFTLLESRFPSKVSFRTKKPDNGIRRIYFLSYLELSLELSEPVSSSKLGQDIFSILYIWFLGIVRVIVSDFIFRFITVSLKPKSDLECGI